MENLVKKVIARADGPIFTYFYDIVYFCNN